MHFAKDLKSFFRHSRELNIQICCRIYSTRNCSFWKQILQPHTSPHKKPRNSFLPRSHPVNFQCMQQKFQNEIISESWYLSLSSHTVFEPSSLLQGGKTNKQKQYHYNKPNNGNAHTIHTSRRKQQYLSTIRFQLRVVRVTIWYYNEFLVILFKLKKARGLGFSPSKGLDRPIRPVCGAFWASSFDQDYSLFRTLTAIVMPKITLIEKRYNTLQKKREKIITHH